MQQLARATTRRARFVPAVAVLSVQQLPCWCQAAGPPATRYRRYPCLHSLLLLVLITPDRRPHAWRRQALQQAAAAPQAIQALRQHVLPKDQLARAAGAVGAERALRTHACSFRY